MADAARFDQRALAQAILEFWFARRHRDKWFSSDKAFDAQIARRFGPAHEAARLGRLDAMRATPEGALALILILDQFSRNLHRGSALAYAQDAKARTIADEALRRRFDMIAEPRRRAFFYMPYMHSETLADQERSVTLFKARLPASSNLRFAVRHRAVIARHGRFPHRPTAAS